MTTVPAAPLNVLSLDEQICFPMYAASNLIQRIYRPLLEPLGLTYPQYLVMMVLWEHDGITVSALGERVLLDSGTLSPLLKRLEERKLVKKRSHAEDGRQVIISVTPAGKRLRAEAEKVPEALVCRMLANGGPDAAVHLAPLRQQLKALVAGLKDALDTEPNRTESP